MKSSGPAKSAVKAPKKAQSAKKASTALDLKDLDRKGLAAKARQLKIELLATRFNLQAPSLKEYRKKRRELATVLAHLG